jgi:hypothetical protein
MHTRPRPIPRGTESYHRVAHTVRYCPTKSGEADHVSPFPPPVGSRHGDVAQTRPRVCSATAATHPACSSLSGNLGWLTRQTSPNPLCTQVAPPPVHLIGARPDCAAHPFYWKAATTNRSRNCAEHPPVAEPSPEPSIFQAAHSLDSIARSRSGEGDHPRTQRPLVPSPASDQLKLSAVAHPAIHRPAASWARQSPY